MDDLFALLRPLYHFIISHQDDGRVIMESSVQYNSVYS